MTTLRLYNTLTKSKEDFVPIDPKNVRMYVCGPTVYNYAHIGNARPVIVFDVLFRLLRHVYGVDHVKYVRNITDVDDKINARAAAEGISIRELTEKTAQQYLDDVTALGCLPPTFTPRATDNIAEMIAMIELLIKHGNAYVADGHVLFDVSSKADYGKLSRRTVDDMIAGARVEVAPYKKNPMDFVMWKPSDAATPGWESPWGRGRPGWHIECSAMSARYLGETFDIHGGGIDLQFPHHENEIAQSEGAHHGRPFANVWMHNGFLEVEGAKMSKSLGNFVTINELLNKFPGGALKFSMLQTHYRLPINWTEAKAKDSWDELRDWASRIYGSLAEHDMHLRVAQKKSPQPSPKVLQALADDLNTSDVITALRALASSRDDKSYSLLIENCEFLGLFSPKTIGSYFRGVSGTSLGYELSFSIHDDVQALKVANINGNVAKADAIKAKLLQKGVATETDYDGDIQIKPTDLLQEQPDRIAAQINARNAARKAKDFKESDRIRDELLAQGIVLKDGPSGTTWEVKK